MRARVGDVMIRLRRTFLHDYHILMHVDECIKGTIINLSEKKKNHGLQLQLDGLSVVHHLAERLQDAQVGCRWQPDKIKSVQQPGPTHQKKETSRSPEVPREYSTSMCW